MPILSNFPTVSSTGVGGVPLESVKNIQTVTASGKVYIKWTDPADTMVDDVVITKWGGTLLIRKAGSAPQSRRDGVAVVENVVRYAYADTYFCDSGLADGTTYYYKFYPYSEDEKFTESADNEFTATPNPVATGDVANIAVVAELSERVQLTWTDPAATVEYDGVTVSSWGRTKVVYKEGSYPTDPNDGTLAMTSTVRNQYAATPLEITGLTNGTTYYFGIFPISAENVVNYNTAEGATATPGKTPVSAVPVQSGTLTYSGEYLLPEWTGYNEAEMTVEVTAQADAGEYDAVFTPREDYCWEDGSSAPLTVKWVIGRAALTAVPTQLEALTYCNAALSPNWSGYDSTKMKLGGTTVGQNAGDYEATFTPLSNYCWDDGSVEAKTVVWTIDKAAGFLAISLTAVTLNSETTSATFEVDRLGDGAITLESSAPDIATATLDETGEVPVVTVSSVGGASGSANITVKVAEGTNYLAPADAVCAVTASFLPVAGKALNDYTWAEIRQISDAGQAASYWNVGDRKAVALSGTVGTLSVGATYYVYILGFDHNSTYEGTGIHFGTFKTALSGGADVCLIDSYYNSYQSYNGTKYFQMNHRNSSQYGSNYGGWKASDMRYDILGSTNVAPSGYGSDKTTSTTGNNPTSTCATSPVSGTLMAALPSDLRAVMKPMTKYTDNTGSASNTQADVTATTDYLPLLSEFEVQGARTYANQYEQNYQKQYAYYSAGNSKVKYRHSSTSSTSNWWVRSPYYNNSYYFCYVYTSGAANTSNASPSFGVAPAFKV